MRIYFLFLFVLLSLIGYGQRQDKVDFLKGNFVIQPEPLKKQINGNITYDFVVLKDVDSVFLDARNMTFQEVKLNKREIQYEYDENQIVIKNNFKEGKRYRLKLYYEAIPKQAVYFLGWEDDDVENNQIWTQGQGKYTSHWLPSFDDMNEKVTFEMVILMDEAYPVIANGKLEHINSLHDGLQSWQYSMKEPMSSYLLAFVAGNYQKKQITSNKGIPINLYYYPKDSLKVEPSYRYSKEIFDFLEEEIGVAYPWQNYKQIPVHDFLYAGMENTGTTIFSESYMIDSLSFVDKNYVNINAHELAHQWFGNMVTEVDGNHHWLHEGFATYYAYLAEAEVFGEDFFYWKLYDASIALAQLSDQEKGESLLNPKASSLTFYEKGALALFILRDEVGDKVFKKGVSNYLKRYQFKNVTVTDFLTEMESVSKKDLTEFKKNWLQTKTFPNDQFREVLKENSKSLAALFGLQKELADAKSNAVTIEKYYQAEASSFLKAHIIKTYHKDIREDFFVKALETDDIKVRQAIAMSLKTVPESLRASFETLLEDKSYVTQENALIALWSSFPNDRPKYLEQTKSIQGLHNKSFRMLWLTLALLTENYKNENTPVFYNELSGYTAMKYQFEIRLGAFQLLEDIFDFTDQNLKDLINATIHHQWQFKKYARTTLRKLMKQEVYKTRILKLKDKLNPEEQRFIQSIIEEIE